MDRECNTYQTLSYNEQQTRALGSPWVPFIEINAGCLLTVCVAAVLLYFGIVYRRAESVNVVLDEWHDISFALSGQPGDKTFQAQTLLHARGIILGYEGNRSLTLCDEPRQCNGVEACVVRGRELSGNDALTKPVPLLKLVNETMQSPREKCIEFAKRVVEITSNTVLSHAAIYFADKEQDVTVVVPKMQAVHITKGTSSRVQTVIQSRTILDLGRAIIIEAGYNMMVSVRIVARNLIELYGMDNNEAWDIGVNTADSGYQYHNVGTDAGYGLRVAALFVDAGQKTSVAQMRPLWVMAIDAENRIPLQGQAMEEFAALEAVGTVTVGNRNFEFKKGNQMHIYSDSGTLGGWGDKDGKLMIQEMANRVAINGVVVNARILDEFLPVIMTEVAKYYLGPILGALGVLLMARRKKRALNV